MSELSPDNWMGIIGIFAIFTWGISILLFSQITVKYIEREMAKENIKAPAWDKGIGGRIIMYAMVIASNKAAKTSPIEDVSILRHSRKKDYTLSIFLIISSLLFFITLGVFSIFFSPNN